MLCCCCVVVAGGVVGAERADHVAEREQAAVDVHGLLEAVAHVARAIDALGAGQVDKVKLGAEIARLRLLSHVVAVRCRRIASPFGASNAPALLDGDSEDRVRATRLLVHERAARVTQQRARLEAGHDVAKRLTHRLLGADDERVARLVLAYLQLFVARIEEIAQLLFVDLDEVHLDTIVALVARLVLAVGLLDQLEHRVDCARNDAVLAGTLLASADCVRFARALTTTKRKRNSLLNFFKLMCLVLCAS